MEEGKLDLISSLPYEILRKIVSFLPLKQAVRTSVLSTAWRRHWAPFCVNLELNSGQITSHEASEEVTKVMGTFLRSYENSEQLKFSLCFPDESENGYSKKKDELIVLATKGVQKELHLGFSEGQGVTSDFQLNLKPICPNFRNHHPTQTVGFSSLKTLHLQSVTHLAKNLVSTFFSNFHLLESLNLEKCPELQGVNVEANDCLQRLVVADCPNMVSITVSAPNLKSFWYQGVLPQIRLNCVPNLVNVRLNLRDGLGQSEFDCEEILSLLASLKDVEILTISGWLLEWLCSAGVIFRRLEFQFNKLKELRWIDSIIDKHKRDSLACFLNISPFLEQLSVDIDKTHNSIAPPFFHHYWHEPHLWMDYATMKSNVSQLLHLKVIKLAAYSNEEDQLSLMDLLLEKAVMLQSMTVTSLENRSWRVGKIPCSQLKQTSQSHPKQVAISPPNKEYIFGSQKKINADCTLHMAFVCKFDYPF
ncbi:hypothetical protein L1049_008853 [Liquidambar formosana]|uniref:F-box domain-containing protein n=1 Tax=Liquidambar formosana TaxID=63359 RepID=A0AAP0X2K1_LIQFO